MAAAAGGSYNCRPDTATCHIFIGEDWGYPLWAGDCRGKAVGFPIAGRGGLLCRSHAMPSLAVQCPGCKRIHEVDGQFAGRRVRCQHCGRTFTLPKSKLPAVEMPEGVAPAQQLPPSIGFQCLSVEETAGVVVARVITPRPDSEAIETLGDELLSLVKPKQTMIVDLAAVEFLSSAALGKLVALDRRMQSLAGTELRLCNMTPTVRQTFAHSGLQALFQVFDNYQAAKAGL